MTHQVPARSQLLGSMPCIESCCRQNVHFSTAHCSQVGATCKHFAAYSLEQSEGFSRLAYDAQVTDRQVLARLRLRAVRHFWILCVLQEPVYQGFVKCMVLPAPCSAFKTPQMWPKQVCPTAQTWPIFWSATSRGCCLCPACTSQARTPCAQGPGRKMLLLLQAASWNCATSVMQYCKCNRPSSASPAAGTWQTRTSQHFRPVFRAGVPPASCAPTTA